MTLFKSWVLIVVLACLLVGVAITIVTGFTVEREFYINTTFGPPPNWHTYGLPWVWRTDGPQVWIEGTEFDGFPIGYAFNGVSPGAFLFNAIAWGLLLALVALPLLLLGAAVRAWRSGGDAHGPAA